jgi:hypothetical protein
METQAALAAKWIIRALCSFGFLIYAAALTLTLPAGQNWPRIAVFLALLVLGFAGGISFVYGVTLKSILRTAEMSIRGLAKRVLRARAAWRGEASDAGAQ